MLDISKTALSDHDDPSRILVVDDTPTNLFILSTLLKREGYIVDQADSGKAAIALAQAHHPTLILLDIMMPHMNGYQVCTQLRDNPATAQIPIIFLSSLDAPFDKVEAFQQGAADYVTKPFQSAEVLARVRHQTELQKARCQQQRLTLELESRVRERTQLLELAHSQLIEDALIDRLTRLPNRLSFVKRLSKVMARSPLESSSFSVLFLDCDRFKRVNDSLGHRIGDQLLREAARRLLQMREASEAIDTVARFGGDEFALLLTNVADRETVAALAENMLRILAQPFFLAGYEIFISISIGMVWGDASYDAAEHLLRDADVAMYQAKKDNRYQYRWFESDMYSQAVHLLELETDLRLALERREFELYYQPIVDLESLEIVGFEALVRWQHPQKGLIGPNEFIPFAEESGFIVKLGTQVLEMACMHLAEWEQAGLLSPNLSISVNIAPEQLRQPDILAQVERILTTTGVSPHRLRLELTERSIIENRAQVEKVLKAFKRRNIHVSIDDFGTGYSALNYLHTLPVHCLKIDRSFVQPITQGFRSLGIVPLIISMAETLNMEVIAEGIENITQLRQLQKQGCRYGQGFLFQKALPAEQAIKLLERSFKDWAEALSA